ncbi:MAG: prepilin-type N-terminal cleavage/methylation domain-containing protein [Gammaproteobacteria bacterium]
MMRARGFTLVELIMGIVVMAVAVGGVLLAMRTTVAKSADPMIAHQGIAVAEAYMEEILTKNFTGASPVCASRATYNSASCYDGLSQSPTNQSGTAIAALSAYTVTVGIGAAGTCGAGLAGGESRIAVAVTHPSGFTYQLDGCITDY